MNAKKSNKASLENKKGLFVEVGLIVALALMVVAFSWSSDGNSKTVLSDGSIEVPEDWNERIQLPVDAPPPLPPTPVISDVLVITNDPTLGPSAPFFSPEGTNDPIPFVPYIEPKKIIEPEVIVDDPDIHAVQEKPTFMNGDYTGFSKWVQQNLVYPQTAIENGQEGKLFLRFRIGKDGGISDIQVIRGEYPLLNAEAIRVIQSSPKWTPARQNNKPVAVLFTMPVSFALRH